MWWQIATTEIRGEGSVRVTGELVTDKLGYLAAGTEPLPSARWLMGAEHFSFHGGSWSP